MNGDTPFRTELTAEQVAILEQHGRPLPPAHQTTINRRLARTKRAFPVISRSGRTYRQPDGRLYGEPGDGAQRQADAKYWYAGKAVREAKQPMTVAVGGEVKRIYEVLEWFREPSEDRKWAARLGRELTNDDLDREFPDYPYRIGDSCPTVRRGAYRPEYY